MSIHARSQLFLIRPSFSMATASRSVARNLPVSARRMHAVALTATRPSTTRSPTQIVAIGAFLSATLATALSHEQALCQQLDAVFAQADGPSGSASGKGKPIDETSKSNRRPSLKDEIDLLIDQMMGRCGEITLAGGLGFCSGYALKQVGKVAAITIGSLFVIAQIASSKGYIEIHWHKVEKDVVKAVDPNGDGKITKQDLHEWYQRLMKVLQSNLPSSAGFTGGFLLGVSCS